MLNERIRSLRLAKGLTLQAVADVFGISRASISSWESGNSNPDHKKLTELADLFGCTVQFLLTGSNLNDFSENRSGVGFITFDALSTGKKIESTGQMASPIHSRPSKKAFATRYPGRFILNWSPLQIPPGSILIVDPLVEVAPTSLVLIQIGKKSDIFLAQVKQTPGNKNYFLIDDEHRTQVIFDPKIKVLGVILEWQLSGKTH